MVTRCVEGAHEVVVRCMEEAWRAHSGCMEGTHGVVARCTEGVWRGKEWLLGAQKGPME